MGIVAYLKQGDFKSPTPKSTVSSPNHTLDKRNVSPALLDPNRPNRRLTPLRSIYKDDRINWIASQPYKPPTNLDEMISNRLKERHHAEYGGLSDKLEKSLTASSKYDELTNRLKEIPLFNKNEDHQQKFSQAYQQNYGYDTSP